MADLEKADTQTLARLKSDMKDAMRARESERLTTIRMLLAALKNKQIDARRELNEEDIVTVLATEAKKRREAAESFRGGDRLELAEKEEAELVVIESYLPQQLSEDEVNAIIDELIASTGAESKRDMGKVMGPLMGRIKGQFDGGRAKDLVMAKLP